MYCYDDGFGVGVCQQVVKEIWPAARSGVLEAMVCCSVIHKLVATSMQHWLMICYLVVAGGILPGGCCWN